MTPDIIDFSRGLGIFNDEDTRFGCHYTYGSGWYVYQGRAGSTRYMSREGTWHARSRDDCWFESREQAMRVLELAILRKLNSYFNAANQLGMLTGRMAP